MSFLRRLFRPYVELPPDLARRVAAWRDSPAIHEKSAIADARFAVVDVETTGLDPHKDRLLSIGALVLQSMRLHPAQGYALVVRNREASERENILVHGIGPAEQAAGAEPEPALMAFLEFIRKDFLVAFHAGFDQAILDRALRRSLGVRLLNPWLDLAALAPALYPEARPARASLDDWLSYFGLRARRRHCAADDAFAAGELFLILLARARARGVATLAELRGLAMAQARMTFGGGLG